MAKRVYYYYLSEDPCNPKEITEIESLSKVMRLTVITTNRTIPTIDGVKFRIIKRPRKNITNILRIWAKICFLICNNSESLTDVNFDRRNIYSLNKFSRNLINIFWHLKQKTKIKKIMPHFESIYLLPLRIGRGIFGREQINLNRKRVFIHDSLFIRLNDFLHLIRLGEIGINSRVAIVKSWDNPYYTQIILTADIYLVWSEFMKSELLRINHIDSSKIIVWGCKAFENFESHFLKNYADKDKLKDLIICDGKVRKIGYAAAFPDSKMVTHEVSLIKRLARELNNYYPDAVIQFRPYPIVDEELYLPLRDTENIEIVEITGDVIDRYGDGRELIKYGSYDEKILFLHGCDIFLSLGTSFSIEASICRVPMIQLSLSKKERNTPYERAVFERLDITDHIQNYFIDKLRTARSYEDLLHFMNQIVEEQALFNDYEFQKSLGLPSSAHTLNEQYLKEKINVRY